MNGQTRGFFNTHLQRSEISLWRLLQKLRRKKNTGAHAHVEERRLAAGRNGSVRLSGVKEVEPDASGDGGDASTDTKSGPSCY